MYRVSAILLTLFILLGLGQVSAGGDVQGWLDMENILVSQLEAYVETVQKQQKDIKRFLDYVDVLHEDLEDAEEYYGNPLNAFTTISRLVNNWKREVIDVILGNATIKEHENQVHQELTEQEIEEPTNEDMLEVTNYLMEAQENSGLPTSVLANDILFKDRERNENVTLSAHDCFVIGSGLQKLQYFDFATEWLLEARSRLSQNTPAFIKIEPLQLLEELAPALQQAGNYKLANKLNNEILKADPKHQKALANKIVLEQQLVLGRLSK